MVAPQYMLRLMQPSEVRICRVGQRSPALNSSALDAVLSQRSFESAKFRISEVSNQRSFESAKFRISEVSNQRSFESAKFRISDERLDNIHASTASGEKCLPVFSVDIVNEVGELVTRAVKTLYLRKKRAA